MARSLRVLDDAIHSIVKTWIVAEPEAVLPKTSAVESTPNSISSYWYSGKPDDAERRGRNAHPRLLKSPTTNAPD